MWMREQKDLGGLHAWWWPFPFWLQFTPFIGLGSCVQCPHISQWPFPWKLTINVLHAIETKDLNALRNSSDNINARLRRILTIISPNCYQIPLTDQSHGMAISWTWTRAMNSNPIFCNKISLLAHSIILGKNDRMRCSIVLKVQLVPSWSLVAKVKNMQIFSCQASRTNSTLSRTNETNKNSRICTE